MKPLLFLLTALLAGCSSQYRVELWNDTGHPVEVSMIERYRGIPASHDRPRATVAAGGWFQYELDKGRRGFDRSVEVRIPDQELAAEASLNGVQIYRARIVIDQAAVTFEPISATDSKLRK